LLTAVTRLRSIACSATPETLWFEPRSIRLTNANRLQTMKPIDKDRLKLAIQKSGRLTSAAYHPGLGKTIALGFVQGQTSESSFSVVAETGACLGRAECSQFPLVS
jgi:glycine cleavage system aminomethyltransferase T